MSENKQDVTQLLLNWSSGDKEAFNQLIPLVYNTLKQIAYSTFQKSSVNAAAQQLQPTALVNEAYVRLIDQSRVNWQNRGHFFAIAAREIRNILVDEYRKITSQKRGGLVVTSLSDLPIAVPMQNTNLIALNEALDQLALLDARQARIVELHFFVGYTNYEIAEIEGLGLSTVEREIMHAKRWLRNKLKSINS
ncbi:MAG: sigma-70 family RNA polymerase sigma factor [Acidobacteria bacterium]|nr:sigma-70 family RNA polymerase sigma factor [Acidobacteriota bacterium]